MDEVENQASIPEVVTPSTEVAQEVSNQVVEQTEDADWIKNLRRDRKDALRRADELERENRMQKELLQRVMTSQQPVQQSHQQPEEDLIQEIAQAEFVPGEKVAKGFKKLKDDFSKQIKEMETKYQQKEYAGRISDLKRDYSDLEDVVNPETLQLVKQKNPRLAETWVGMDDYTLYVQAYPYIKNSGILDDVPGYRKTKEVEKKLEQNKKTVQSPAAFEKRPMAQAFDLQRLSKEQKDELQKEMYHYASLAGGY